MPIARLVATVLDCADPARLGRFYSDLVGGTIAFASPEWVQVNDGTGRPILGCQRVDGYTPPTWPIGERPAYAHLDFYVDDLDAAEPEVVALGAVLALVQPTPDELRVYLDPAGHPFCTVIETSPV
jgi:catechol 2,3-dioxygenase-like lactoylglutathione lyase family enzyme